MKNYQVQHRGTKDIYIITEENILDELDLINYQALHDIMMGDSDDEGWYSINNDEVRFREVES